MTQDTQRALDMLRPIAYQLGIQISADDEKLYCNGQAIGIGCNSTYATIKEFMGYALWYEGEHRYPERWKMPKEYAEKVQEFWVRGGEPDA